MSSERPFRHLCPEADLRDAMTDEEFWDHVLAYIAAQEPGPDPADWLPVVSIDAASCGECGEVGACGYDAEGRALIHVTPEAES